MNAWAFDGENHRRPATCSHTDEKKDLASHGWNEGVVTTPANYGVEGVKTYTCSVCSAKRTESIPALSPKNNTIAIESGFMLGVPGTNVIEPIELGEKNICGQPEQK